MPSRAARVALPAKLTPPQLQGALPRDRLFTWLDHHASAGAVWISGAPGAGKTVLAASWVDARGWPRVWYRLDTDDNDLGRFFTLLGLAVDRLGAPQRPPVFAAEHMARPEAFARLWFRHVFTGLSRPLALVLDNLEQARLPALPGVLAAAIAEALPGVRLIVTCRHDPPPELAPCTLTGMLVALPPTALRFNGDEALSWARQLGLDAVAVGAAVQRVQGWAAGLRLLVGTSQAPPETASQQVLFDYFAGLLHDRLNPADQRVLLAAALLPWVPAPLLAEVSGEAAAPALLEMLAAQHLFTERLQSGSYRLHPLFRGFLKQRGAQSLAAAERLSLLRRAAAAFAASGDSDTAIDLLLDAGDTADATALLVPSIEARLAAGQLEQVAAWCRCLGETALDVAPWLRYGLARACFLREDAAALHHYARAAGHFAASGESTGERLCAAGLLEYRYNADSFDDHVRWCAVLRSPSSDEPVAIEYRLRLLNGRLLACYYGGDFEHEGGALVEAVLDALVPGAAENEKLSAGITLLGLLERHKRWEAAHLLAGRMEALLTSPQVGPRLAILVRQQIAADLHRQSGAYVDARRLALQSRNLAREHGFAVLQYEAVAVLTLVALFTGDEAASRDLLAELAMLSDPGSVYHQRFGHAMRAWHALQGGRSASAREHADALRTAVARSDMPARLRATWLQHAMLVRFATGDADGALAELDAAALAAEPGSRETLQVNRLALQAWRAHGNGDDAAAIAALQRSWELAEPIRCYQVLPPLRDALSTLAGLALQHDIAPAFTRELIARRRLVPASPAARHWPWPLRVYTLGAFSLEVDGVPLRFAGKAPKKPLALLKALVALGPRPVAESTLADLLWPDDDQGSARDALHMALHRLRRLLPQGAELLSLNDGQLALDDRRAWVDCRAFERLADAAENGAGDPVALLRDALALYRGHFLAAETAEAWSVSARERLRMRCRRVVAACATALAASGRAEDALDCWRRGLEIDDLDEAYTQGVMAIALQLGRPAEGLAAYQRCRRTLSLAMGIAPSAATERLAQQLRALAS